MKAAVMFPETGIPQYTDAPEPIPQHHNEILVTVKAVAIKHLDKGRAAGTHYSNDKPAAGPEKCSETGIPGKVIGGDGVFLLPDGTRIYALGASGTIAEKATVNKAHIVPIPANLDDATAAALPNAVAGSAMALLFKAGIQPGDTVLVNGATGFTGRVAVQLAKHYKAGKVIATGRNKESLRELLSLGADEVISLNTDDNTLKATFAEIHQSTPIDIVIDYLWGHSAELILSTFKGNGAITNKIRYVSVGAMSGDLIQLSAANLRSVDIQLTGSGLGAWSRDQIEKLFSQILPETFNLAATNRLTVEVSSVPLHDIAALWHLDIPNGRRVVVSI